MQKLIQPKKENKQPIKVYQITKEGNFQLIAITDETFYREYNELGELIRVREVNATGNIVEVTFHNHGAITTQRVKICDEHEEERLNRELISIYERCGFSVPV